MDARTDERQMNTMPSAGNRRRRYHNQ